MAWTPRGAVATSSWDGTARLWGVDGTCQAILQGHSASVLAVACHPAQETYVTASADKTLKLWGGGGACLATLHGHTDVVRGVAVLPAADAFVSCANDATLRVWNFHGQQLGVFTGHQVGAGARFGRPWVWLCLMGWLWGWCGWLGLIGAWVGLSLGQLVLGPGWCWGCWAR